MLGSGCALSDLKEANQRLKESRDRLLTENNRLDSELKGARQEIALMSSELNEKPLPEPAQPRVANNLPPPTTGSSNANALLIPESLPAAGVEVTRSEYGITLTVPDQVFFASGQAKLSPRGQGVLRQIARILNQSTNANQLVRVDGHTDDVPIRKVRHLYPTNWELSTARACTVVRYLVDRAGVRSSRIYPAGFGSTKPRASGSSSTARAKNRRVEIQILNRRV
jgi:chemotaxis protein MotB